MLIIDHEAEAEQLLEQSANSTGDPTTWLLAAQVHATLALVNATEKQTAILAMILVAMQTGMTNEQCGEFDRAVSS